MRSLALILLLAPIIASAQHMNDPKGPCQKDREGYVTDSGCFGAAYQKADRELNRFYAQILKHENNDPDLRKAQRLWIQFRDANCYAEYANYEAGSAAPTVKLACLAAMTRNRIAELHTMYDWRLEK